MSDRQQTERGQIRRKRGDTRIDTIEKEYGVDFGVRGDTKLATYLEDIGFPSLSKALKRVSK